MLLCTMSCDVQAMHAGGLDRQGTQEKPFWEPGEQAYSRQQTNGLLPSLRHFLFSSNPCRQFSLEEGISFFRLYFNLVRMI